MKTQTKAIVVSATNYDIDGSQGGNIFMTQQTSGRNPSVCGYEVIKVKAPFDLVQSKIDKRQNSGIPGVFEILLNVERGAQNKARAVVESMKPFKEVNPVADFIRDAKNQTHHFTNELNSVTGLVLGATKYLITEQRKGAKLYLLTPPDKIDEATWAGYSVLTMEMDYERFSELKLIEQRLPGILRVSYQLEHGQADAARFMVTKVELASNQPTTKPEVKG